jgi:TetR/AcrR family transcriptional repressor of bet genes
MEPIRRAQVIQAVIQCIVEGGLETLTMDAVAGKAGVSKGVVNHYFTGKRDLLLQSFQAFLESYNRRISNLIRPDLSAMDMLGFIIDVCFPDSEVALPLWEGEPGEVEEPDPKDGSTPKFSPEFSPRFSMEQLGRVYVHFLAKTLLDQGFKEVYLEVYASYLAGTMEVIRQGVETGEFRDVDPREAAYGFLALVDGIIMYHNIGFQPLSPPAVKKMCREYVHRYLLKHNV